MGCDVRIKHQVNLSWTASTDNVGVHRLHGGTLPGRSLLELRPNRHADHNDFQRRPG